MISNLEGLYYDQIRDLYSAESQLLEALPELCEAANNEELRQALAHHLATQPTKGLGLIKRALLASSTNDLDAQLDLERDLQREAGRTEDYREGVRAFMEKRPATFKGR